MSKHNANPGTVAEAIQALRLRLRLDHGLGVQHLSLDQVRWPDGDSLRLLASKGAPSRGPASSVSTQEPLPADGETAAVPEPMESEPDLKSSISLAPENGGPTAIPAEPLPPSIPAFSPPLPVSTPDVVAHSSSGGFSLVPYVAPPACPEKEAALEPWRQESIACQRCGLCQGRNTVVWGEGNLSADVMFIGEGPGRDEDIQGRPFVGRSGRLLTDIIEKGMRLPRNQVYIANVVKCRPPGNRDPRPEEVEACSYYLTKQIEIIDPKVIVAVGGVAGCALLGLPPKSPGLRGRWRQYNGKPLRVIFHPSYLLRQRGSSGSRTKADMDTWKDVQEVMQMMETTQPS